MSNIGEEIYKKSITIIDSLLKENPRFDNVYSEAEKAVVKRVIHATSDINYAETIFFTNNSVQRGINLINGKIKKKEPLKIVCDSEMTKAGISKNANKNIMLDLNCYIGFNHDILAEKRQDLENKYEFLGKMKDNGGNNNITKTALSIRLATIEKLPDIIVIGNAPTALVEVMDLCKRLYNFINYNPPIIIAMPVGFVGAAESKKLLYEDNFYSSVGNFGNFGGSSSAASAVNALLSEGL